MADRVLITGSRADVARPFETGEIVVLTAELELRGLITTKPTESDPDGWSEEAFDKRDATFIPMSLTERARAILREEVEPTDDERLLLQALGDHMAPQDEYTPPDDPSRAP